MKLEGSPHRVVVRTSRGIRVRRSRLHRLSIESLKQVANSKGGRCLSGSYRDYASTYLWECAAGHQFERTFTSVARGGWCPECKLDATLREFKRFVQERHGGQVLAERWPLKRAKLRVVCSEGHQWLAEPSAIRQGYWCARCAYLRQRIPLAELRRNAEAHSGILLSAANVPGTKLEWQCSARHRFWMQPKDVRLGHWCPRCPPNARKSIEDMRDLARKNGGSCLSDRYEGSDAHLRWRCALGHVWRSTPSNIRINWCPRCNRKLKYDVRKISVAARRLGGRFLDDAYEPGQKGSFECAKAHRFRVDPRLVVRDGRWCSDCRHRRYTIGMLQEIARKQGGDCLSPHLENAFSRLKWRCERGHVWIATAATVRRGSWCAECNGNTAWTLAEARSIARERGGACLSSSIRSGKSLARWRCADGHLWSATVSAVLSAGQWCGKCHSSPARQRVLAAVTRSRGGRCDSPYRTARTPMWFRCRRNHRFQMIAVDVLRTRWCPRCP